MDGSVRLNCARLKALRKSLGMSQEYMAYQCRDNAYCVSLATLKRAEAGHCVYYRTVRELARFYNIPITELLA
jgi:transcriptional regulator with XRE-family HTH domain